MGTEVVLLLCASALVVGVLAGCTGIGPALLPPMLAYLGGMNLHLAMATSMWSFLLTATTGTVSYSRRGSVNWNMVLWLSIGIIPAAILGARVNALLPTGVLSIILATVIILAGLNALLKPPKVSEQIPGIRALTLLPIGAFVGFGSALTGTGGPILLIPVLLVMRVPTLIAIGVSQVIVLPLAAFSTVGYFFYGQINFAIGTSLGVILALGVLVGVRIAHSLPTLTLQRILALALIGIGLLIPVMKVTG